MNYSNSKPYGLSFFFALLTLLSCPVTVTVAETQKREETSGSVMARLPLKPNLYDDYFLFLLCIDCGPRWIRMVLDFEGLELENNRLR